MSPAPRLLIVTAAFGEGHNSAARNLAAALQAAGAETRVEDPCKAATATTTTVVERAYRFVTTHMPRTWAWVYRLTDRCDFSKPRLPLMRKPENALARMIDDFHPDAVVSTYPLYPYFLARILADAPAKIPVFTVVTDSIEINASWLRAPSDLWLVTDPETRRLMAATGLPADRIMDTGFAVNPVFEKLTPVDPGDACQPFRILYFATAQRRFIHSHGRALLDASPNVRLTVVMGRNTRMLAENARELRADYPGRVRLVGWTRKVPDLMNRHHLIIGKAGGATVHEAIAARCPMLIHHLVPGQEEGNLALLRQIGGGDLADSPDALQSRVQGLLADDARAWRDMKNALIAHNRTAGGRTAAECILGHLKNSPKTPQTSSLPGE
jgi:processive 1,2-diacylglycerol beta-glucosyltransferase